MSNLVSFNSLTGVNCSQLTYSYKTTEKLKQNVEAFSNGLTYNRYALLSGVQDAVISKNNILFLTDIKELSSCLDEKQITLDMSLMPSLVYLKQASSERYIKINEETKRATWSYEEQTPLFFALVADYTVEILTSKTHRLEISSEYPYRVYEASKATTNEQLARQRFIIDVFNNKLTLKAITKADGPRYLAIGYDNTVMGTGTWLNNTVIKDYVLEAVGISRSELVKGSVFQMEQIKYYNEFESLGNKKNVLIEKAGFCPTSWLVSTTLEELVKNTDNTNINLLPLKTNFNPSGTFSNSDLPDPSPSPTPTPTKTPRPTKTPTPTPTRTLTPTPTPTTPAPNFCPGNLLINGDFSNSVYLRVGGTAAGWTLNGVDVHEISIGGYGAVGQPVNPFIDLMSVSPGWISQTVNTTTGATYKLEFSIGADMSSVGDNSSRTVKVGVNDTVVGTFVTTPTTKIDSSSTYADFNWRTESVQFVATGTTTNISFSGTSTGAQNYGPVLDNVCLTLIP